MASTYLTRTVSSGADLTKWTWSCWVKRTDLVGGGNNYQRLISNEVSGNTKSWYIRFQNSTQFHGWANNGAFEFTTNGKYRDINGWYHLVVKYDSTQSTEADRFKVYVNGEEPSMSAIHYPTLNETVNFMNSGNYVDIGFYRQGSSEYFYGLMSHMHFTAGYAYDASSFGSTDSTTGEWKINTSPSVTYGSLGFFILKDGNSVTDQSGNGNNFTVGGGTLTKTEDNPSNVFATLNPLAGSTDATFIAGNTTAYFGTATSRSILTSTLGAVSGKYYWECKIGGNVSPNNATLGVGLSSSYPADSNPVGYQSDSWGYKGWDGTVFNNSSSVGGTWATFGDGDIIGVAVNLDDEQGGLNKLYFSKNGVWQNGADPSNFTSVTGVVGITKPENGATGFLFAQFGDGGSNATPRFEVNFGNGYFQQTAVSSAGTNASGNGIFEYDVPTGFTALSTKGLNS